MKKTEEYIQNLSKTQIPEHIAIIMDGNRRWAKYKALTRSLGHHQGAKNLQKIVKHALKLKIKFLTVYAFSSENWTRSKKEVNELIALLDQFLDKDLNKISKQDIRVKIIGNISKFPDYIIKKISHIELTTKENKALQLNIALSYGSREEIINAVNNIIQNPQKTENLTEQNFSKYLYTSGIPDPDLMIRTGGNYRLSNFLLWQSVYSELYFTDILWPDFNETEFNKAIINYSKRERRYGSN